MMDLGIELLRTFVAVAEGLHFTRAGERLHMTQSAVSQQIKRLERDLGVALFERKGPNVLLAPAGESFLPHARRVLQAHDEAVSALTAPEMIGLVKMGFSDELAMCYHPTALKRFAEHYPRIQIETHCDTDEMLEEKLALGDLDFYVNATVQPIPGAEILARTPLLWVASGCHFAQKEDPLPLAVFPKGSSYRDHAIRALEKARRDFRIAYSSPSLAGIHGAILSGLAVSMLIEPSIPPGAIVLGPEEHLPALPMVNIHLVRRADIPAVSTSLADIVGEVVRQVGGRPEPLAPREAE